MLLYLHIPFCHRICPYCAFYKHTPGATPIGRFVEALVAEAQRRIPEQPAAPRTLYLGGGTPSMLSPTHLKKLFAGLAGEIDFNALEEVTFEANPATFDLSKARLFHDLGIRRVSLGIQSFSAPVLRTLGREHTPGEAAESVAILKQAGLPEINIDLMFSVPGLTLAGWRHTLEEAIRLAPQHISAYNLTYEEDTEFLRRLQNGELDQREDRDAEQFYLADELLTAAGYEHYETSNYALPGHRSTHNHGYWSGEAYLGLGPSAVSTLVVGKGAAAQVVRSTNLPDTARYVEMVEKFGHATIASECLDPGQRRLEQLALLLRTSEGVPLSLVSPADPWPLVEQGLAVIRDARLVLTRHGSALVDPIVLELI